MLRLGLTKDVDLHDLLENLEHIMKVRTHEQQDNRNQIHSVFQSCLQSASTIRKSNSGAKVMDSFRSG